MGLFALAANAPAQPYAEYTLDTGDETLRYSIRAFPPGANVVDPAAPLEPTSALNTA